MIQVTTRIEPNIVLLKVKKNKDNARCYGNGNGNDVMILTIIAIIIHETITVMQ